MKKFTFPAGTLLAAVLLGGVLVGACGRAEAVVVAGPAGSAEQGLRLVQAAPVAGAQSPVLALVASRIDAVNAATQTLVLRGKPVGLHPTALKVLGPQGQPLQGPGALRAGQLIRFALEAEPGAAPFTPSTLLRTPNALAAPPGRRIVLIYVDAQP